jgi:hypothetical protein
MSIVLSDLCLLFYLTGFVKSMPIEFVTSILTRTTSVSMETKYKQFIIHGNHGDSFVEVTIHICMVFGCDLLCDLLEILHFNKCRSAVATRRRLDLVDPIQPRNISGLMALKRIPMETFHFIFSIYFLFLCVIYFRRIFKN